LTFRTLALGSESILTEILQHYNGIAVIDHPDKRSKVGKRWVSGRIGVMALSDEALHIYDT
jgi:hypothetical protein